MPWCDTCSRYLTPTSLDEDGTCPTCDAQLADPKDVQRAPWHFWMLLIALALYLGWRAIQGIGWVLQHT